MLLNGWIDFSGRFNPEKSPRIVIRDGEYGVLYASRRIRNGQELLFTQSDMSQFIDTAAAASNLLAICRNGWGWNRWTSIGYIFPEPLIYINLESAITIGLYPDLPRERFVSLGNSSLKGAYALLTDGDKMEEVAMLQERIEYLEFGAATGFYFADVCLPFLPHTDFDLYPTVKAALKNRDAYDNQKNRPPDNGNFPLPGGLFLQVIYFM